MTNRLLLYNFQETLNIDGLHLRGFNNGAIVVFRYIEFTCNLNTHGLTLQKFWEELPYEVSPKWGLFVFFVVMLLCSWLLEKICIFYNDDELLLSKPFQRLRFVLWSEIGSIQKRNTSAQLYNMVDRNKHRIGWFSLIKKTQPFLVS